MGTVDRCLGNISSDKKLAVSLNLKPRRYCNPVLIPEVDMPKLLMAFDQFNKNLCSTASALLYRAGTGANNSQVTFFQCVPQIGPLETSSGRELFTFKESIDTLVKEKVVVFMSIESNWEDALRV